MKAMIFAAGLGTRLGELTQNQPKALVEVHGKALLWHAVEYLKQYGISEIIINIHHHGNKIREYVKTQRDFGISVYFSDETDELLDTGGGLVKASGFFDDEMPFVAYNVDVITRLNISEMLHHHQKLTALATLAVKNRITSRYFIFDDHQILCGWINKSTGQKRLYREVKNPHELAFSGIQILSPEIFKVNKLEGKFSLTDMYLNLAKNYNIFAYRHDDIWFDLGKPEQIKQAEKNFFIQTRHEAFSRKSS